MISTVELSPNLWVHGGAVNVGIIGDLGSALLIDTGDAEVLDREDLSVDMAVFTHHHRDQACGAWRARESGARIAVPREERWLFDEASSYWDDPAHRWHLYDFHPHHLTLTESVAVDAVMGEGDELTWGDARITALSTPGHTDGSVSYVVEVDGERTVFCGDLLYGPGQVWELYSMQKGNGVRDYHGFMGSREEVFQSLGKIESQDPDRIVPSHGGIMEEPRRAIRLLVERLERCYDNYASVSSLRHYFPQLYGQYLEGPGVMGIRPGKGVPEFLAHHGTTWVIRSVEGPCLAMDCGNADVTDWLREEQERGTLGEVEGMWITHYHDDHVDGIPAFREEFDCEVVADSHVAEVVGDPMAWRLPCISPVAVDVDRVTDDGEGWRWHEFEISAYHLPGQTLYSGGLLVEGNGLKMLFSGDSFTPGGIDDHCCSNRNWLGPGVGYNRCLDLVERLEPDLIFNCHVAEGFDFTPKQIEYIRRNLAKRMQDYRDLLPWDNPNYGLDPGWVRCHPYQQSVDPGETAKIKVVVTNHSRGVRDVRIRLSGPRGWGGIPSDWTHASLPPGEGEISVTLNVPGDVRGRYVVPVDLVMGERIMIGFTEFLLDVGGRPHLNG